MQGVKNCTWLCRAVAPGPEQGGLSEKATLGQSTAKKLFTHHLFDVIVAKSGLFSGLRAIRVLRRFQLWVMGHVRLSQAVSGGLRLSGLA